MLRLAVLIPLWLFFSELVPPICSLLEEEDQSLAEFWITTDLA